ncbi:hypothetical protein ZWY2020_050816 [Hordeum vulgare]|nr:hypothetical protein ZWY2020_050816 [Hordeum vulgare]
MGPHECRFITRGQPPAESQFQPNQFPPTPLPPSLLRAGSSPHRRSSSLPGAEARAGQGRGGIISLLPGRRRPSWLARSLRRPLPAHRHATAQRLLPFGAVRRDSFKRFAFPAGSKLKWRTVSRKMTC